MDESVEASISQDFQDATDEIQEIPILSDGVGDGDEAFTTALGESELATLQNSVNSIADNEDSELDDSEWPDCDSAVVLLAMNQAYSELVSQLRAKVQALLDHNKKLQKEVLAKQKSLRESEFQVRLKIPLMQYLPPYFKDESGMCPRLNDEAKRKLQISIFDPLAKEEKKWTPADVKTLRAAVRQAIVDSRTEKLRYRKQALVAKIAASGVETSDVEREMWKEEADQLQLKIDYIGKQNDTDLMIGDFSDIDWVKLAGVDFASTRTANSLRLKWMNEVSPMWNQGTWSKDELAKLKDLRENDFISASWTVLASRLGTRRSPWQCFEKYKTELEQVNKDWTPNEDEKLIALANMLTVNGKIQWEKVTYYMPGRSRQQIRTRYLRTLDKNVKHGRWTDQEDLLLMCAVNRFGAKDWAKVARSVPGRTDVQCRERWVSTLDRRALAADWSLEDDEKIIYAVQIFGREWFRIGQLLNKPVKQVRARYISLLTAKVKLCAAQEGELRQQAMVRIDNPHRSFYSRADVNKIYRTFNALMKGNDPHGDEMLKRIDEKTPSSTRALWKGVSDATRSEWTAKEQEIVQRHRNGNPIDVSEMLANIQFNERDAEKVLRSRISRRFLSSAPKQPIVRPATNVTARIEFTSDDTEEERIMCMTEAMCQVVHSAGQLQWADVFKKSVTKSASAYALTYLVDKIRQDVDHSSSCYLEGNPHSLASTLPPNATSIESWEAFQRVRPSLCKIAVAAFTSVSGDKSSANSSDKQLNELDKLFIPIGAEIKDSKEYLSVKSLLRTVLLEPARLSIACDSNANQLQRDVNNLELAERVIELSATADTDTFEIAAESGSSSSSLLNATQQVTFASNAYVSDGGRDKMEFTIDEVIEKVCKESQPSSVVTPAINRRGRKKKSPLPQEEDEDDLATPATNRRGRKKKSPLPQEEVEIDPLMEIEVKLKSQSVSRAERAKRRSMKPDSDDDSERTPSRQKKMSEGPRSKRRRVNEMQKTRAASEKKKGRKSLLRRVVDGDAEETFEEVKKAVPMNADADNSTIEGAAEIVSQESAADVTNAVAEQSTSSILKESSSAETLNEDDDAAIQEVLQYYAESSDEGENMDGMFEDSSGGEDIDGLPGHLPQSDGEDDVVPTDPIGEISDEDD